MLRKDEEGGAGLGTGNKCLNFSFELSAKTTEPRCLAIPSAIMGDSWPASNVSRFSHFLGHN